MISMFGSHSPPAPRRSFSAVDLVVIDLIAFAATQDECLGRVGGLDSQRQVVGLNRSTFSSGNRHDGPK
jgi:hypothetical protein